MLDAPAASHPTLTDKDVAVPAAGDGGPETPPRPTFRRASRSTKLSASSARAASGS